MVDVWLVELDKAANALESEEQRRPRLAIDDLERIAKLNHADLRRQRRLSTIALRTVIAAFTGSDCFAGVPFERLPGGKPALPGATVSFSVSHAAGRALFGLSSKTKVGIDLEHEHTLRMSAARQQALVDAANALPVIYNLGLQQKLPQGYAAVEIGSNPVLRSWVRLEALAKLDGVGMGRLLTAAGIMGRRFEDLDDGAERHPKPPPPEWPSSVMEPGIAIADLPVPADDAGNPWYAALAAPASFLQPHAIQVRALPVQSRELASIAP